jgi:hypothetical protein
MQIHPEQRRSCNSFLVCINLTYELSRRHVKSINTLLNEPAAIVFPSSHRCVVCVGVGACVCVGERERERIEIEKGRVREK